MKLLVVDHIDSFVFNLVEAFRVRGCQAEVLRHDAPVEALIEAAGASDAVVLSPGPGHPEEAERSIELLHRIPPTRPVLGVCLGHQIIVRAFGGEVGSAGQIVHGKTSVVEHDGEGVFRGLPATIRAGRYHSLAASALPEQLISSARTRDGVVMAIRHRTRPIIGLQFHPESILTSEGGRLFDNFKEQHESRTR